MQPPSLPLKSLAVLLLAAGAAMAEPPAPIVAGPVTVAFHDPAQFSDDGRPAARERGAVEIGRYLADRAQRRLPAGERLDVTLVDIRRAGREEPWRFPSNPDLRVVRDTTPPRIELEFRLVDAQGTVLKQGSRTLRDLAFLDRPNLRRDDPLSYEKNLLDDWLAREFAAAPG